VAAKNGNKYEASVGTAFITLRSIQCKELALAGFSEVSNPEAKRLPVRKA
jgi:hypothetical protein